MRTVEVLLVIMIILGTFGVVSQFTVLPSPSEISSRGLRELALTTLQTLDARGDLSDTLFSSPSDGEGLGKWGALQRALSSSLPPNVVYNLTAYDIITSPGNVTYSPANSITNSESGLGVVSESSAYIVTSSKVTFDMTPQKIGEKIGKKKTLYILNCNDSNGWWITGYTSQSLASDLYNALSPYFETTVLLNSTYELGLLLNNSTQLEGTIQDAVVINPFGEAVPIPTDYCEGQALEEEGYDEVEGSYAPYCHLLGERVNLYNWTWVSIVGYPLFYVTNTDFFADDQNTYGIYGMVRVGSAGLNAFLQGIDDQEYFYDDDWITADVGEVQFSPEAYYYSNYYGVYSAPFQWATRALPYSILNDYGLDISGSSVFNIKEQGGGQWIAGATFRHVGSDNQIHGALTSIGLTRIPDIRVTVLGLLLNFRPIIYRSKFGTLGTSRLVVLQLSQQGGV